MRATRSTWQKRSNRRASRADIARCQIMPSSVIKSFAYDPDRRTLAVEFVSGRRYRYDDVPGPLVEAMRRARSKGKFFNRHVRDHFATTEIN